MRRVLGSRDCVVCGAENPSGMRLRFAVDAAGASTEWTVAPAFQGFRDVLQGGMILAILDDCMWYAVYGRGGVTLTAEASVRYRARVAVGAQVRASAEVVSSRGRLWICRAELRRAGSGELLASAEGRFMHVPERDLEPLIGATAVHELPAATPEGERP